MPDEKKFLVRDVFNEKGVKSLSAVIKKNYPAFESKKFSKEIVDQFPRLSFIERSTLITDTLFKHLPKDFSVSAKILVNSLMPEIKGESIEGYGGFIVWPMTIYISRYGMEHFEISMHALCEMTKRFSAESAIRYFLIQYPDKTLKQMEVWAKDTNPHVRRLVSEGSRPRLPWAIRLHQFVKNPSPVIKLLELLKEDPALLVRRSVANNINDIAKDHPDTAASLLIKWYKSKNEGTKWIVKHASRTLVKTGHKEILHALGYSSDTDISVQKLNLSDERVHFGGTLEFSFRIKNNSDKPASLMIDYLIHHKKANGATSPKVFKLTKKTIEGNQSLVLQKKHSIKEITTRKYYPGDHFVEIQINGIKYTKKKFELIINKNGTD